LEIGNLIPEEIAENYEELMAGLNWIPCENKIKKVDEIL
jgi:hypothetical protein